jgi:hypothetical protein
MDADERTPGRHTTICPTIPSQRPILSQPSSHSIFSSGREERNKRGVFRERTYTRTSLSCDSQLSPAFTATYNIAEAMLHFARKTCSNTERRRGEIECRSFTTPCVIIVSSALIPLRYSTSSPVYHVYPCVHVHRGPTLPRVGCRVVHIPRYCISVCVRTGHSQNLQH